MSDKQEEVENYYFYSRELKLKNVIDSEKRRYRMQFRDCDDAFNNQTLHRDVKIQNYINCILNKNPVYYSSRESFLPVTTGDFAGTGVSFARAFNVANSLQPH